MLYALLGRVVWSVAKRVVRRRLGRSRGGRLAAVAGGRLPLVAGLALAVGTGAFSRARRARRS